MYLFCDEFSPFCKKYFEKEYFCHKFALKTHHGCLQYKKGLKILCLKSLAKYTY
jgi:hypothetical protein